MKKNKKYIEEKIVDNLETLFVFDFDDTLASTSAEIGVQKVLNCGSADQNFGDWLEERNILFNRVTKPKTNPFFWMSSANFALYESCHSTSGGEDRLDHIIDYSMVGISSEVKPIKRMVDYFRKALTEEDSETIVLTARTALKETYSPSMERSVGCDNRKLIQHFLKSQKISFPVGRIHAVGDSLIHTSVKKASVVLEHICRLNPSTVIFFDDSILNLEAVDALNNIPCETAIIAYQVYDGGKIKKFTRETST